LLLERVAVTTQALRAPSELGRVLWSFVQVQIQHASTVAFFCIFVTENNTSVAFCNGPWLLGLRRRERQVSGTVAVDEVQGRRA